MTASEAGATFVISRVFKAPRRRVWDAWTKPDLVAKWFGPKGVTTHVQTFDLRPGGMLHSRMDTPDGGRMWAKFVYREVDAPTRLVWLHSFSDESANIVRAPFSDHWPLELLTTVTFEEASGGTKVTLTWTPHNASPEEEKAFAAAMDSMRGGWTGSFDQLDEFLRETT